MRRPGYLQGWEEDFKKYMQAKHKGWQSQQLNLQLPDPRFHVFKSYACPLDQMLHPKHGCVPERDIIASTLKLPSGPSYTPPNGLPAAFKAAGWV